MTILMPKSRADASVGIYALSYGIGGQGIGGDHLSFPFYQFTAAASYTPPFPLPTPATRRSAAARRTKSR